MRAGALILRHPGRTIRANGRGGPCTVEQLPHSCREPLSMPAEGRKNRHPLVNKSLFRDHSARSGLGDHK